jgi:hypothetical protein
MVKHWSSNGRQSHAGSSFVNFPVDHPNENKKNESPNSVIWVTRITEYLVIWVIQVIRLFGSLGDPNNRRTERPNSPECTRI